MEELCYCWRQQLHFNACESIACRTSADAAFDQSAPVTLRAVDRVLQLQEGQRYHILLVSFKLNIGASLHQLQDCGHICDIHACGMQHMRTLRCLLMVRPTMMQVWLNRIVPAPRPTMVPPAVPMPCSMALFMTPIDALAIRRSAAHIGRTPKLRTSRPLVYIAQKQPNDVWTAETQAEVTSQVCC